MQADEERRCRHRRCRWCCRGVAAAAAGFACLVPAGDVAGFAAPPTGTAAWPASSDAPRQSVAATSSSSRRWPSVQAAPSSPPRRSRRQAWPVDVAAGSSSERSARPRRRRGFTALLAWTPLVAARPLRWMIQRAASAREELRAERRMSEELSRRSRADQGEIIKLTEENIMTTAGLLGGLLGLFVGGFWLGAAVFASFSYMSREQKDNTFSKGLRGIARGTIEVLNYTAKMDEKYELTNKVGDGFTKVAEKAKQEKQTSGFGQFVSNMGEAMQAFDKDVGIMRTAGTITSSASDVAASALNKVVASASRGIQAAPPKPPKQEDPWQKDPMQAFRDALAQAEKGEKKP
eukprot:TRINITY_DN6863_c0_g1_i1.p1 TRINITY_DN6863_c0_g1~~TRINITY_DN6863_c0_g1_i1.p1  ORF type:complete len:348 (+),score=88.61 TRINITY_DN6863_c0_g1_i1:107-1150(+)